MKRRPSVRPNARQSRRKSSLLRIEALEARELLTAITVNSTGDSSVRDTVLTLREALEIANQTLAFADLTVQEQAQVTGTPAAQDTITFNLPAGPQTINLDSLLPTVTAAGGAVAITGPVDISGRPLLEIRPTTAGALTHAFLVQAGGSRIASLTLNRFSNAAIVLEGATGGVGNGSQIFNNFIGTDLSGTAGIGNGNFGIQVIGSSSNLIGGTTPGTRNLISGNTGTGVRVESTGSVAANGNQIVGNFIGTGISGLTGLGNGGDGISLSGASTTQVTGNVLAGNTGVGVRVEASSVPASGNAITANLIGVNAGGSTAVANSGGGIVVTAGATGTTIGGTTSGAFNVIGGNGSHGIRLAGATTSGTLIQGNLIGLSLSGSIPLANLGNGIFVDGAVATTIGGATPAAANLIVASQNWGIRFLGSTAASPNGAVINNLIGTTPVGTLGLGNGFGGIAIDASTNVTVGGDTGGTSNLISGNNGPGVAIRQGGAGGNVIQGNFIGTNGAGTAPVPNNGAGVAINDTPGNVVGGTTFFARNLISGNTNNNGGLEITGDASTGNLIQGNLIGTNAAGSGAIPNSNAGISIEAPGNSIGGTALGAGNVISGNLFNGVTLNDNGGTPDGNLIQGNLIGVGSDGVTPLPNGTIGISVNNASNNSIGGSVAGAANIVAFNGLNGITVAGTSVGNSILRNSIFSNTGLGIDLLGVGGSDANDAGDPDTGGNNLQNFPVLDSVVITDATTVIAGTFNSTPNRTFRIEFFSHTVAGPNNGGGRVYLGALDNVATDGSGDLVGGLSFAAPTLVALGQFVTATATDLTTGDTSEFALATEVTAESDLEITYTTLPATSGVEDPVSITITVVNLGPSPATSIVLTSVFGDVAGSIQSVVPSQGTSSFTADTATVNLGLLAGGNGTATVTITYFPTGVGTLNILSSTVSATPDTDVANNTDVPGSIDIEAAIDLSLSVSNTPLTVLVGETVTYEFLINNAGPSAANNVVLTSIALPANAAFVPFDAGDVAGTSSQGAQLVGNQIVFAIADPLAANAPVSVRIVLRALENADRTLDFSATVSSDEVDPTPLDNTRGATTNINPAADVSITTVGTTPAVASRAYTYTVTVSNAGPSDAANTTVLDVLPAGVTFVPFNAANPGGTSASFITQDASGNLVAALGTIGIGSQVSYQVVIIPTQTGTLTITSQATSGVAELDVSDNTTQLSTGGATPQPVTVLPLSDLQMQVVDAPDPIIAGDILTYTILITNAGPSTAENVTVVNTLPEGVEFLSAEPSQGSVTRNGREVRFLLGAMQNGGQATAQIFVRPQAGGTIVNSATISSDSVDDIGVNTVQSSTTVTPSSDLAVSTSVTSPALLGQPITYVVTVVNNGPSDASNVVLTNALPGGLAPASSPTLSQGVLVIAPGQLTGNVGTLASGQSATLTFVLVPSALATLTNTASVTSSSADRVAGNNTSSSTVTVSPAADVAVGLAPLPATVRRGVNLTYSLTVTNSGPSPAAGVVLSSVLPANLTFVSASSTVGTIGASGGVLTGNLGTLAAGQTATITVVVLPTVAGPVSATFAASTTTADLQAANNSATGTTTAVGQVGSLALSAAAYSVDEGAGVATITVVRVGGDAGAASVGYVVTPSTAQAGLDFTQVSGRLDFADGETVKTFAIPIIDNQVPQDTRIAVISLVDPALGASLAAPSQATLAIVDNDAALRPGPQVVAIGRLGRGAQARVMVTFNEPMDPATAADPANYSLFAAGRDRRTGTGDDVRIAIASVQYDAASRTAVLTPVRRANLAPALRLVINGSTPTAPLSASTRTILDGDANGRQGGDFVGTIRPLTSVFDPRFYEIYRRFVGNRRLRLPRF